MKRIQSIPEISQDEPSLSKPKKSYAEIRKAQTGVRGAIGSLGAWGVIALSSVVGGKVAGNMSADAVHHGVAPLIEGINEAVTPNMCKDEYEGFKGIILGEMDGRLGKIINTALDSVDMRRKVQTWLDAITRKMNSFREDLCSGLKKVPGLTHEIDLDIQKFTRRMVQAMTTAMLLLALSMTYRGHKRRSLNKLAEDTLAELEQELAREKISKKEMAEANGRMEERVRKLEEALRANGTIPEDTDARGNRGDDVLDI